MKKGQLCRPKNNQYKTVTVKMSSEILEKVDLEVEKTKEKTASKFIEDKTFPVLKKFKGEVPRRDYRSKPVKKTYLFTLPYVDALKKVKSRSMGVLIEELLKKVI